MPCLDYVEVFHVQGPSIACPDQVRVLHVKVLIVMANSKSYLSWPSPGIPFPGQVQNANGLKIVCLVGGATRRQRDELFGALGGD